MPGRPAAGSSDVVRISVEDPWMGMGRDCDREKAYIQQWVE